LENQGGHVIFWPFIAGNIQTLALSLATDIARRFPAAIANSPEPLVSPQRRREILDEVFSRAGQYSVENRLSVLARIRLGSALKWRLKEMGYDETFIDLAAEHLIASVTRQNK
jgi:hypothetical protein